MKNEVQAPLKILFFASLAEKLGVRELLLNWRAEFHSEPELRRFLSSQAEYWQALLDAGICCAVNQQIVRSDHPITPGDEIAYFPPVTGG
jgi:sulfur-carrier protein